MKLSKQFNDEKRANLVIAGTEKRMKKQYLSNWHIKVMIIYGEMNFVTTSLEKIGCKI